MTNSRVLVLEDDPCTLQLVSHILESEGFEVCKATDGEEAVRIFLEKSPTLLVLDVMVPKLNGIEVCRLVRRQSDVPIMMLTAIDDSRCAAAAREAGANDYLTKPFEYDELVGKAQMLSGAAPSMLGAR